MINMPAVITETGDIRFHAKEGVRIPISFQNEDGTPRDMTVEGTSVKFYVEGFPTITLVAGATSDELVLLIPQGTYNDLVDKKAEFALVDETATPPNLEWSGTLMVTGFA
jgi:hypothetical protein